MTLFLDREYPGQQPPAFDVTAIHKAAIYTHPSVYDAVLHPKKAHEQHRRGAINTEAIRKTLVSAGVQVDYQTQHLRSDAADIDYQKISQETDLIILGSGDGGQHDALQALLGLGVPVWLGLGGNANDLTHMTQTLWSLRNPARSIHKQRISPLHPIQIDYQHPDKKTGQHMAAGYFTIGYTALVAARLNENTFRTKTQSKPKPLRFLMETKETMTMLPLSPTFTIERAGSVQHHSELAYANGRRMAKVPFFSGNQLLQRGAVRMEVERPTELALGVSIGKALLGKATKLEANEQDTFQIWTQKDEAIQAQVDGEIVEHPSGTTFTVSISTQSVPVLNNR